MITTNTGLNTIFNNNKKLTKMTDMFKTLGDAFNPNKKPFNPLMEKDREYQNKEDKKMEDLSKVAVDKHYTDRMSREFDFLELTPDNINTYELGFRRGVAWASEQTLNLMDKQTKAPTLERNENY